MIYFINVSTTFGIALLILSTPLFSLKFQALVFLCLRLQIQAAYTVLYTAAFQFCLGIGILEMSILALRIVMHSPLPRKAETIENIVFWLGTSYLVITYLVNMTIMSEWFVFWAGIILIGGLALVARAFVLLAEDKLALTLYF